MTLLSQIARFGVVGTIGFAVDGGVLLGLMTLGLGPFFARLVSFPVAVLVTWWLNRIWTFRRSAQKRVTTQVTGYFGVQLAGAAVNYCAYVAVLSVVEPTSLNALAALAVGSGLGMFVNFLGARHFVFAEGKEDGR